MIYCSLHTESPKTLLKLVYIQTVANTFNDMKFNKDSTWCEELTPANYKIVYKVQYTRQRFG